MDLISYSCAFIYLFGAYHQLIWGKEEEEEEEVRPCLCI
jgi:hypothetical protein